MRWSSVDIGGRAPRSLGGRNGTRESREVPRREAVTLSLGRGDRIGARPHADAPPPTATHRWRWYLLPAFSIRRTPCSRTRTSALCGFPLRRAFEERFSFDCRLEADSNAAAAAEYRFGAARGAGRLLGITIGTGLGGAVIIDGALLRYTGECAGDLGHIILDQKGPRCSCGARGCLEALVSSGALSARAGGRSVREIIAGARSSEKGAVTALAETGAWLGLGLASLAPLFAPDIIVVGGEWQRRGPAPRAPASSYRAHARQSSHARRASSALRSKDGRHGGSGDLFFDPLS